MGIQLKRLNMKSRMTGDCHVRFCEGLGVKSPRATRPDIAIVTLFASRRYAPQQKVRQCTQCRLSKC
jgi:hypothetical protein